MTRRMFCIGLLMFLIAGIGSSPTAAGELKEITLRVEGMT